MTIPFQRYRSWLPGLITALMGVACVRLLAPLAPSRAAAGLLACGYLLVPVGLAVIARQVARGARQRAEGAAAAPEAPGSCIDAGGPAGRRS